MSAKLIVTSAKGGSRITLVSKTGAELLSSRVFAEPRAKGAVLRSLKTLLGESVTVEDNTLAILKTPAKAAAKPAVTARRRPATTEEKPATAAAARKSTSKASAQAKIADAPARPRKRATKKDA